MADMKNWRLDDDNSVCPYCDHSYQVEQEDYSEDSRTETCEECGKSYEMHQSFSVSTHTERNCELNNEAHNFSEPVDGGVWCQECGKYQSTPERKAEIIAEYRAEQERKKAASGH